MWLMLLALIGVLLAAAVIYLIRCFHRFSFIKKLGEKRPALSWLVAALPLAALGLLALAGAAAVVIAMLHLAVAFLLCALLAFIMRKAFHRELSDDLRGVLAIALTAVYLGAGWFFAHHVYETDYAVATEKRVGTLRIVMIADAHLGMTLDGEAFAREMERVGAVRPDAVVIVGDFIDDGSTRADILAACGALGALETRYGVYFVFGNHDEGYYGSRDYTPATLRDALRKNGVVILEDEKAALGEDVILIGRRDRRTQDRKDAAQLTAGLDRSKYLIMLDHQPNDYDSEAAAGVDLVLSGHTHGGHIFPAGPIGLWLGANDQVYGREERGATTFIVTSGISGWGIPFKTGAISEFVVIDVSGAAA